MANKKQIVIKVKYPSPEGQDQDINPSPEIITEWNVKRIASAFAAIVLLISLALYFIPFTPEESSDSPSPLSENQPSPEIKQDAIAEQAKITEPEEKTSSAPTSNNRTSNQPLPIAQPEADKNNTPPGRATAEVNNGKESTAGASTDPEKKQSAIPNKKRKLDKVVRSSLAHKIVNKEPVRIINSTVKVGKSKAIWVNYFTELKGMKNKAVYHEWLSKGRIAYRQRLYISSNRWRAASRKLFNAKSAGAWQVRTVDKKGRLLDQKEFNITVEP